LRRSEKLGTQALFRKGLRLALPVGALALTGVLAAFALLKVRENWNRALLAKDLTRCTARLAEALRQDELRPEFLEEKLSQWEGLLSQSLRTLRALEAGRPPTGALRRLRKELFLIGKRMGIYEELLRDLEASFGPLEEARKRALKVIRVLMYNLVAQSPQDPVTHEALGEVIEVLRALSEKADPQASLPAQVEKTPQIANLKAALKQYRRQLAELRSTRTALQAQRGKLAQQGQRVLLAAEKLAEAELAGAWLAVETTIALLALGILVLGAAVSVLLVFRERRRPRPPQGPPPATASMPQEEKDLQTAG